MEDSTFFIGLLLFIAGFAIIQTPIGAVMAIVGLFLTYFSK